MIDVPVTERADNPPVVWSGSQLHDRHRPDQRRRSQVPDRDPLADSFRVGICRDDAAVPVTNVPGLRGIGIWGNNIPVAWGFDIINFVWWIGIGHAGTLISAILLLLKQDGGHRSIALQRR